MAQATSDRMQTGKMAIIKVQLALAIVVREAKAVETGEDAMEVAATSHHQQEPSKKSR